MERKSYKSFHQLIKENNSIFRLYKKSQHKGIMKAIWDSRQVEVENLKVELKNVRSRKNELEISDVEKKSFIEDLYQQLKLREEKLQRHESELTLQKLTNETLFDDTMDLLGDLETSREYSELLTKAINLHSSDHKTYEKELKEYLKEIKLLESKLEQEENHKYQISSKKDGLLLEKEAQIIRWRRIERERGKQILELTRENHGLMELLKEREIRMNSLETMISQKDLDIRTIEVELEDRDREISQLGGRILRLKEYSREELLEKMEAQGRELLQMREQIKNLEQENEDKDHSLRQLNKSMTLTIEERNSLFNSIEHYKELAEEGMKTKAEYSSLSQDIRGKNQVLFKDVSTLRQKVTDLEQLATSLDQEREMLIRENRVLKNDVAEKERYLRQHKKLNYQMNNELARLSQEVRPSL